MKELSGNKDILLVFPVVGGEEETVCFLGFIM